MEDRRIKVEVYVYRGEEKEERDGGGRGEIQRNHPLDNNIHCILISITYEKK